MVNHNNLTLNGTWLVDYLSDQPYTSQTEPEFYPQSGSVTPCPVPGYWEDMGDLFRSTELHTRLRWNPLYTRQRYPQAGYVPDMALPNPTGCFVYQQFLHLENIPSGCAELFFGGVQNSLSAWINGCWLGRHEGYSSSFSLKIPPEALVQGKNRITLAVSNTRLAGYLGRPVSGLTSRAANECTGGIWGDVELRFLPDGLRDIWVSTEEDCLSFCVHTDGAEEAAKTVQIYDGQMLLYSASIPAGERSCFISAEGLTRWTPDSPRLYTAVVSTERQTLSARFGVRRLTARGTKLYLNGTPYYFRGICEHCYQPETVHPTRDKRYYRMIIREMKELGFNSIRFHTWVPPREYMEAADELGMVMEIESPNNTAYGEWEEIVRYCRPHAAVMLYSTGNELQIDAAYEEHLQACADLVHRETDSLFSPMSAMRGVEYNFLDGEYVEEPFRHNPRRLAVLDACCDVYNSYSNALTSYSSAQGTHQVLDERNAVYGKPLLSHEICIHGTYIDLSLEERYRNTRIGDTAFMSSVRQHLQDKGLLDRAPLYYRNSSAWQQILRKHCFETVRRCESFAGYDFLGNIDTHWHTFGYCVGMMNEFYELKPGEAIANVRRYNSDTVLLADLPPCLNVPAGRQIDIPLLVSHYGKPVDKAHLQVSIAGEGTVFCRKELRLRDLQCGELRNLYTLSFRAPKCSRPMTIRLTVTLSGGDTDCENAWELYVFPRSACPTDRILREQAVTVMENPDKDGLWEALQAGKSAVVFGAGPFASSEVSWQIALAGRTNGHLATVIADHPLMEDFPHSGYCGRQFEQMLNGSRSVILDLDDVPHRPIVDIASSYKNAHKEAMLVEFRAGKGKLLICTLNLSDGDPAAVWLKNRILTYVCSSDFHPEQALSEAQFAALCRASSLASAKNANEALNQNDITM